jgi:serine/threonine-protein kinase
LLGELGGGGTAEVLRARVRGAGGFQRDVVIKRLLAPRAVDAEFVSMFTDEARILGALHHQNVVQALDFGEHDGKLFLVLEHLDGPSLSRVLLASPYGIPAAIAAYIGREICRALDYVHSFKDADGTPLGLIHRDVTPSNVIVTPTGAVKLLDFGIAKFAKAMQETKAGTVKGKTAYVAPEQLNEGKPIDGRVDLFSAGIVLHELLVGERLFAGNSDLASLKKILELDVPLPSSKRPGVPPELDRIVMKALERDPDRRFASAAEMARALDEVVLASRLHVDDVAAFARGIVSGAPKTPPLPRAAPACAPARPDFRGRLRRWQSARPLPHTSLATTLGLALGLVGAIGLGIKIGTKRGAAAALHPTAIALPAPPPLPHVPAVAARP